MQGANLRLIVSATFLSGLNVLSPAVAQAQDAQAALPTVTVSADPLAPSLLEYGKPASVLSREEIESRSNSTLGDAVGLAPGVRSSSFGQGAGRPVIRGFSGERVRVLRNGVTTGDASDLSDDHAVAADPLQASQIEILRGPETLLYGSSAIGGAVNVIDEAIPETALGKPFEGRAFSQFGDAADDERTYAGALRGEQDGWNWRLSGFSRETTSYEIPGYAESAEVRAQEADAGEPAESESKGKVLNSDTDSWGASLGGSYIWDRGFFGVSFGGFGSKYGVPGHAHEEGEEKHGEEYADDEEHEASEEAHGDEGTRIDAKQWRLDMRGRVDQVSEEIESLKFRAGYTNYEHDEIEGGEVGTTFERETFEGRLELAHSPLGAMRGAVGAQFLYDDLAALGEESFIAPTKTAAPALFLFEKYALSDQADLQFGGRVESVSHNPLGRGSKQFTPFSFSAGPLWSPGGDDAYTVGLTASYVERAPTAIELFADGAHHARQSYEQGDSSLDKEASWGVDLALKKNHGAFTGALTPFYQRFVSYLNLAGTGEEMEGLPLYRYEEIGAHFWGFELQSAAHLDRLVDLAAHRVALEYQLDFVRARDLDRSDSLPRTPPLRNILRARYAYAERLSAYVEGVLVERQGDLAENELPTDGYALLNAEVRFKAQALELGDVSFFLRGSNLTDEEAREHVSFLKDLAPLRGRAFIAGAAFTF